MAGHSSAAVAIRSVRVEGLFGQYSYSLTSRADVSPGRSGDVFILYGDNGAGKTTVLRALYHLLSASNKRGHRNALAEIPFRQFSVVLHDGSQITLSRKPPLVEGPYSIRITKGGSSILETEFSPRPDSQKPKFQTDEDEKTFISFLEDLDQPVYFLSADRQMSSDTLPDEDDSSEVVMRFSDQLTFRHNMPRNLREHIMRDRPSVGPAVSRAVRLADEWIRRQTFGAANRGTDSSHHIYSEIVRNISQAKPESAVSESAELKETLNSIASRSRDYARFGFTPELDIESMMTALSGVDGSNLAIIKNVLAPYINGTNARLDQLKDIYALTSTFVNGLNSFYRNKSVEFDLADGIRISTGVGVLEPDQLSSGEKQLLLLFCHALISNGRRSIFIIDEPELSLNVKWQRSLLRALLDVVRSGAVQFVLATHSIELLSDYEDCVAKLEPIPSESVSVAGGVAGGKDQDS